MHNSDTGLQGSSPRDARFMQFIANGPGIAGFQFTVDPEDGDAAAQFLAHADMARVEEGDFRVSARHSRELSLEAIEGLGVEFVDPTTGLDADDDREDEDEEGDAYPDEDERPRAVVTTVFRDGEFRNVSPSRERLSNGRLYWEMDVKPRLEVARLVSKALVAAEARKAAEAKPEPPKGNGNGRKPVTTPPVGKFLTGVVIDQGHKGLLVDIGNGLEARVPIADEYGHGSWQAAAAWLHSHTIGTKVRVKVVRVLMNGHAVIEAVLSDRHPRPWWRKKEANEQIEAPAAN